MAALDIIFKGPLDADICAGICILNGGYKNNICTSCRLFVTAEDHMENKNTSDDFLDALFEIEEINTDTSFYETKRRYEKLFGHGIPSEMLPESISEEQLEKAMRECITEGRDDLLKRLGVETDDKRFY